MLPDNKILYNKMLFINNDTIIAIVFVLFTISIGIVIGYNINPIEWDATNAITECESNIPRDKHCKIIAVIDEE
jgi:ABC-type lipoprotein release transport system permease subunit